MGRSVLTGPERTIVSIQLLRAMAAIGVTTFHVQQDLQRYFGLIGSLPRLVVGAAGVDVFFVISGFVMAWTQFDAYAKPGAASDFMARRVIRIVPLYWMVTALYLAIMQVLPGLGSNYSPTDIARSLFFIPTVRPDSPDVQPIVGQGWSLNYEMLFYILFALALLLKRSSALPLLCLTFVALVMAHYVLDLGTALHFWTTPIIMEFLAGLLIGTAARSGLSLPTWAGAIITLLGAVLFFSSSMPSITDENRLLVWGLPAVMIVGGLTLGKTEPVLGRRTFIALGDASYTLYLIHPLCIRAFLLAAGRIGIDVNAMAWPLLIVAVCLSLVASILVHHLIERPTTRWLRLIYDRRRRIRVAA